MGQLTKDQSAANIETAYANAALNRVNQVGPYGSTKWVPPAAARTAPQKGFFDSLQPTARAPSYSPQSASQPAQQAAPRPAMQPQDGRIDPRSMSPFGVPWSIGPREVGDTSTEDQGPSFEPYQGGREYDAGNITGFDASKAFSGNNLINLGMNSVVPGASTLAGRSWDNPLQMDSSRAMYSQGPDGTGGQIWSDNPSRVGVEVAGYNGRTNPREGAPQGGQGGSGYGSGTGYGQAGGQQAMGYGGQGGEGYYGGYDLSQPWTQITTLDPAEQANLDRQRSLTNQALGIGQSQLTNIGNTLSTPLNFSSLGAIPNLNLASLGAGPNASDYQGPNSQTTDTIYNAYTSRLAPQWDREREAVESRLATQGVNVQTNPEAYSRALEDFNKSRTDAYQMALAQAVGSGVQENSNAFNRALAGRQQGVSELGQTYNSQMGGRQQGMQEMLTLRNQPINELAALLGTSGGVNTPQFGATPQVNVAAPDVMGANSMAYNAQQNTYNQQQQSRNAAMGAAGSLAGVGLSTAFPAAKVASRAMGR